MLHCDVTVCIHDVSIHAHVRTCMHACTRVPCHVQLCMQVGVGSGTAYRHLVMHYSMKQAALQYALFTLQLYINCSTDSSLMYV